MSNLFWKNFYLCFSTFKSPPPPPPLSPPSPSQQDHHHPPSTLIINTFNSLYDLTSHSFTSSPADDTSSSSSSSCDTDNHRSPPDLAAAIASQRFFSSSPGPSNSIFDSPDSPPPPPLPRGGVAVHTYSPDPYSDFRRSMQEMVEARDLTDVKADWDFLHELLLCYLRLNPKHAHKFILRAFSDLLVSLMPLTVSEESCRKTLDRRRCPVSRRLFYV